VDVRLGVLRRPGRARLRDRLALLDAIAATNEKRPEVGQ